MVRTARSLEQAIESDPKNPADLILIVLAGEQSKSLSQIKQLRAHTVVPILIVSDLLPDDLHDSYFEAGPDLGVMRPYSVRALLAQIHAILRHDPGKLSFSLPMLTQKDVVSDSSNRTVKVGEEEPMRFTQLEFRLLYTLMTHVGQVIPTEQIIQHVWGYLGEVNRELVRGLMQRLRSKVETTPKLPKYILIEPGPGYYFQR